MHKGLHDSLEQSKTKSAQPALKKLTGVLGTAPATFSGFARTRNR